MSEIIMAEMSGKKDIGSITPEEIIRFCIRNNVNKINSMHNLWRGFNPKTKEEILIPSFDERFRKDPWEFEPTNIWEFDIN